MDIHNMKQFKKDLKRRHFDFVLGSIHFVDDLDVYFEPFWSGKTIWQAERRCLEATLDCVKLHDDFDVLAHLTYISKAASNPTHRKVEYERYRELVDEILRTLARKGKGMEVNTSGMTRCGVFLPEAVYLRRFKELGGEIVTVGSDAHDVKRVGENCMTAARQVADIFGYVCTFADRKPVFHSKKTLEKGL
jgi:histidinol-phosphatase (PHP family)